MSMVKSCIVTGWRVFVGADHTYKTHIQLFWRRIEKRTYLGNFVSKRNSIIIIFDDVIIDPAICQFWQIKINLLVSRKVFNLFDHLNSPIVALEILYKRFWLVYDLSYVAISDIGSLISKSLPLQQDVGNERYEIYPFLL